MTTALERPLGRAGRVLLVLALIAGTFLATADPFTLVFFLSYAAVGVVLVVRRPRNAVSWLVLAIGFGFIPTTARPGMDAVALAAGTASTADFLNAWLGGWGGSATFVGYFALMLLFPAGTLPAGRWRRPAIALIAVGVLAVVFTAAAPTISFNPDGGATSVIVPNRFAILPDLAFWMLIPTEGGLIAPIVALMGIGAVSMVVRYRRATGILRLQLRWLVAAVAFVVLALVSAFVILFVVGEAVGGLVWIPAVVAYPTVPIAIGIAITRYRLYEINRIVSRTLSWAIVTGALVAVFAAVVVALQSALVGFTQGETLAVAASTLAAFALFQPIRRRVQAGVDRRFNRSRYDAERTAATFAERLRGQVDLAGVEADLAGTVVAALQPSSSAIWLRSREADR